MLNILRTVKCCPLVIATQIHCSLHSLKSTNKSFYTEMLIWLYILGEIPIGYTGGVSKWSNINAALKPSSNVAFSSCGTHLKQKIIRRLLLIQLNAQRLNQVSDPLVKKTARHMYTAVVPIQLWLRVCIKGGKSKYTSQLFWRPCGSMIIWFSCQRSEELPRASWGATRVLYGTLWCCRWPEFGTRIIQH